MKCINCVIRILLNKHLLTKMVHEKKSEYGINNILDFSCSNILHFMVFLRLIVEGYSILLKTNHICSELYNFVLENLELVIAHCPLVHQTMMKLLSHYMVEEDRLLASYL